VPETTHRRSRCAGYVDVSDDPRGCGYVEKPEQQWLGASLRANAGAEVNPKGSPAVVAEKPFTHEQHSATPECRESGEEETMDALTFLRPDQKSVLGMLEVLNDAPAAPGAESSGLSTMVTNLIIAESQHEAIE
jgi:hypothetical protein